MTESLTNLEAEQAMLAAILVDNRVLDRVVYLRPGDFSDLMHGRLFEVCREWHRRGQMANPVTLRSLFDGNDAGGNYLDALSGSGVVYGSEDFGRVIHDLAMRREIRQQATELIEAACDMERPATEVLSKGVSGLRGLVRDTLGSAETEREVAERIAGDLAKPVPCYATGLPTFDQALGGGLYAGKLCGIAARKKVGKTIMLGTISYNLNRAGVKHLFVALEMSPIELVQRNIARAKHINSIAFLKRDMEKLPEWAANYAVTCPENAYYERAPGASFDELKRVIGEAVIRHGIKGVMVDYWQLVTGKAKGENEEFHLRNVAQWLADICRKENLWCLIAAQVNQDGNTRGGEGLKLACDVYFTLHRDKESDAKGAWMGMEESRYVPYADVGSKDQPGLWLNSHGPHFEDMSLPAEMPRMAAE